LFLPCPFQNTTFWESWIAPPLEELDDHKAHVTLVLVFLGAYWLIQTRYKNDWPTITQLLLEIAEFIATSIISRIPIVGDLFNLFKARANTDSPIPLYNTYNDSNSPYSQQDKIKNYINKRAEPADPPAPQTPGPAAVQVMITPHSRSLLAPTAC